MRRIALMRNGYTLLEMLGTIALLTLVFMLSNEPVRIMILDVPRQHREFQTAASLDHLLNRLKTDIEAAKELKTINEPNMLIIISDTKTIAYHFDNKQINRMVGDDPNSTGLWTLPDSHLAWEVQNQNALQITGWLERTVMGQAQKKFQNSHLFYVKGFKPGETQ
jgi:hypothetical protein